jgi:hypothetical protein
MSAIADGSAAIADGVMAEYEMLRALGRTPIPVGATGGAAAETWKAVVTEYTGVFGTMPRRSFELLNNPKATPDQLVGAVEDILKRIRTNLV